VREDQVVVDLGKRMNNVLEIDEVLRPIRCPTRTT
jgi:hypothetical protein